MRPEGQWLRRILGTGCGIFRQFDHIRSRSRSNCSLGDNWTVLRFFREMATDRRHRHDDRDISDGLRSSELAESREQRSSEVDEPILASAAETGS
jgi:hypothetical protein